MKIQHSSERGQILVIIVLAMIGLFGMTALAVDGSRAFFERRHAQNAVDAAALGAAWAKVRGLDINATGLARAASNGYDNDGTMNTVNVYHPPHTGVYANNNDYVQVIISSNFKPYFAPVIGIRKMTVKTQAVAIAIPTAPVNGNAIIALNKTAHQAIKTTGSGPITVHGGGIYVNSNASNDALSISNTGAITVDSGYSISIVGGYSANPDLISPTPVTGVMPVEDPLADFSVPANPGGTCQSVNYSQDPDLILNPGCYNGIKNSGKGKIILNPGLYYLDSGDFSNSGSGGIVGDEVTIYVKTGGVSLTGPGYFNITAPTTGTYAGMVLFVDRSNTKNVSVTGNGSSYLAGTIYAAASLVTVTGNGGSTVMDSQIVADKVATTGSGAIIVNYDGSASYSPGMLSLVE